MPITPKHLWTYTPPTVHPDRHPCVMVGASRFVTPNAADGLLIAAAPALIDALILALPYVEMAEHDESYKPGAVAKVVKEIRAAINKTEVQL